MTSAFVHEPRKKFAGRERLAIAKRDNWLCCLCGAHIDPVRDRWILEHKLALANGGDNEADNMGPAHERCAIEKTKADLSRIAKGKRIALKHYGAAKSKSRPMPGTKRSGWKHKMSGEWERR